jgi:Mg2+-importing ATPase
MLPNVKAHTVTRLWFFQSKNAQQPVRISRLLEQAAYADRAQALQLCATREAGLTEAEAAERLDKHGPNVVGQEHQHGWLFRLGLAMRNPLVILLGVLAVITFATAQETSDYAGGVVMILMVALGVGLRFVQETRADKAAAKLKAMISVTTMVVRDGQAREVSMQQVVPGDIIKLAAGDMIPADLRLLNAKDLFLNQASLTGESLPVEKADARETQPGRAPLEYANVCYLGTTVESGSALGVVTATGKDTYFGTMASTITAAPLPTSFDKGISRFTWLMIKFMLVMVPLVFIINALTKHTGEAPSGPVSIWDWLTHRNWSEAFMFALSVAVGLTPEMLPMIVSVCLSKGALAMSQKKVIVKRLNSIQNFGAMNVLCTDKTGTLTMDHVILERYCDVAQQVSHAVLADAFLISYFQTGLRNVLDRAILDHEAGHENIPLQKYKKLDELPFDFTRRMMSVVVEDDQGQIELLCKGAPEAVFARCKVFEINDETFPLDQLLIEDLKEEYQHLSADGFRVLAVAGKKLDKRAAYTKDDENDLVLKGYVAFLDPPKDTARQAIEALQKHGITVKVLTGDNDLVTKKICHEVGLETDQIVLGAQVEAMDDAQLAQIIETAHIFARLSPLHKQRIVLALQKNGHVVGFMGDGINDAPGLRAADVGISVDTAVDIAKESADVILLEKSLMVLEEGVLEGRKVFANIVKYVRMGASSNFGNMFSVLGASALFPFLPMRPIQVLTNNLLYDFSQVPIPKDEVDPEQVAKPRPWNIDELKRFILFIGPISSIFDYTTYFMMWWVFKCQLLEKLVPPADVSGALLRQIDPSKGPDATYAAALFQTGWFVESLMTQTLIIHVIRTNKIPFVQSRASWPVIMTTIAIMAIGAYLPFSPLGGYLGFAPLPGLFWPLLALTLLLYMLLTQALKWWLLSRKWI